MSCEVKESNPWRLDPSESSGEEEKAWRVLPLETGGCCFWNLEWKVHSIYYTRKKHKYLEGGLRGTLETKHVFQFHGFRCHLHAYDSQRCLSSSDLASESQSPIHCQVSSPLGCLPEGFRLNIFKIDLLVLPPHQNPHPSQSPYLPTPPQNPFNLSSHPVHSTPEIYPTFVYFSPFSRLPCLLSCYHCHCLLTDVPAFILSSYNSA